MSPGSDYLPGAVNPTLTTDRRGNLMHTPSLFDTVRTLEITMNQPRWNTTELDPFTEADLARIAQEYVDHEEILSGMDPDEARSFWKLEDGYLVFTVDANTIRIGHGLIDAQTSWWVDLQTQVAPTHGQPTYGWEYQSHFPGIFTADWVNWLYNQWLG
ncbi:hypothetical protein AS032_31910 [Rhodococcus qingshengii]|nr:hypothetical protein ABM90_04215 [Rhodococcus erythropolis]KSU66863.1 hypothetical protein AS032_31910 [Rhodococcus qingshengii]SCC69652.1 hypothetical protein GA0061093_12930 [Rhodococcus qingshengii]